MSITYIKGGQIIDPSQDMDRVTADLVLEDGKVKRIIPSGETGLIDRLNADCVIDALGKIVCPGFIDIHMHEDPWDEAQQRPIYNIANCMLRMGVTTCVGGNCGSNEIAPDEYLDGVDRVGAPTNLALMAGHTFLRRAAGGTDKYAPVDGAAVEKMAQLCEKYLSAGCMGVSFGVKYIPGTRWEEIIALAKLCRKGNKMVSSHVRNDVDGVFDACAELARIGREAGVKVQFSHVGSMGGYGQMPELLKQIEGYLEEGIDMMCDCYPYEAFSTEIGATTYDEKNFAAYRADYDRILLCDGPYAGQRCDRALFEKMRAERPETMTVGYFMRGEDVKMALHAPFTMLGSDGILVGDQGHPRAAGAFPRFLRVYALEGGMDLYKAIAKMTAMPAQRLGLPDKGTLKPGADADVVIFDPERICDCATYEQPVLPPIGIDRVLIAGQTALINGNIVRGDLGRAVRR